MIQNITFPEGVEVYYSQSLPNDYYSSDFEHQVLDFDFSSTSSTAKNSQKDIIFKPFNSSKLVRLDNYNNCSNINTKYLGYLPTINTQNLEEMTFLKYGYEFVYEGNPSLVTFFNNISEENNINGFAFGNIIWYPIEYDYTKIKNVLPTLTYVPYGVIPVRLRVLKDGAWMDGTETIEYNHTPMTYIGGGLYGLDVTVTPRERYMFPIKIGENKMSKVITEIEQIIYVGDNSDVVTTLEGDAILELATSNDGWYYDAELGGVRNNAISDNQSTTLTISSPSPTITLRYGQSSEKNYDFCTVYDGNGNTLLSLKGAETTDSTAELTSATSTFTFTYKKDGSSANGKDAFWIKSITYTDLPDYPTN